MIRGETARIEHRELRTQLQGIADDQLEIDSIPLALAHGIHNSDIDTAKKRQALGMIRGWTNYSTYEQVPADDPYGVRYHISQYAALELGEISQYEPMMEVDLSELSINGASYADILSQHTSLDILQDPDVAIIGGAARLGLKMYAGVDITSEVPLSDIDAVISIGSGDVGAKARKYGIDLSGAKIIDGDVRTALDRLVTTFDCTINQAAIYNGKLFFSERALEDVKEGNIRLVANEDPLFGSEGVMLPDGNTYINRVGFYRGLSFLIRGKGTQLIVSEENIEQEKESIGRYWQVMLFVKLLPIADDTARYNAIGHWHEIATRLNVTQSQDPQEFLAELMKEYPETHAGHKKTFNAENQARWIIGRLINEASSKLYEQEVFIPPATYTESNLSLADSFADYDFEAFMEAAKTARQ